VKLVSLLKDRPRGWRTANPVVVSGGVGGVVNATSAVTLTARGYDASGDEIKDLFFTWSVQPEFPGGAVGSLVPARDGRTVVFRNQLTTGTGVIASTGSCKVWATAVYAGEERRGSTPNLNLAP
jgi:hypothetical protein